MAEDVITTTGIAHHGAGRLPSVDVDSFNIELKDDEGFLGDRASKGAFREIFDRHDSILAVDIGGTNIRCGLVETRWKKANDLSKAEVWKSELWRHADDEPTREGAVKRLVKMLKLLIGAAEEEGYKLAPFIGIACPGVINE